eukprot:TRINITY_DN3701_c0_g1_i5.p1 TRINITY_DN3701_c0_g1~~TRINITY_DN3701_c0_g1_i5.p1  ORF type:complete len:147 (-),score=13.50 TRINITY_DN3701_c0_g1_i5:78-518(-)
MSTRTINSPTKIVTYVFDGFSTSLPAHTLDRCSYAFLQCSASDYVCEAVADPNMDKLEVALHYACDPSVLDCSPINPGGSHYEPNTLLAHSNWMFEAYFEKYKNKLGYGACAWLGISRLKGTNFTKPLVPVHVSHNMSTPYELMCV